MRKKLLIIFYRNPELGKVKTRLAAALGDDMALAIYIKLVHHTRAITENLAVDKVVCYSNYVDTEDNWPNGVYSKELQKGETLGQRLEHAVKNGFDRGYASLCVIGTDCFELSESILKESFGKLEASDAVIGPARDGGYYLLGLKNFPRFFFTTNNGVPPQWRGTRSGILSASAGPTILCRSLPMWTRKGTCPMALSYPKLL